MSHGKRLLQGAWLTILVLSMNGFGYAWELSSGPQALSAQTGTEPKLDEEQMKKFLLEAKVTKNKSTSKGIAGVLRLTMSDGTLTHDAAFASIDETKTKMELGSGRVEMNFRDSWKYNVAAYELAKLVGLGDMMPVHVVRSYAGKKGSLSWWLPVAMDEGQRIQKKIQPPDPDAWNKEMFKMRVFTQLVYDTDRNLGNVLISEQWHLYMIDFGRAFRLYTELENAKNIEKCERQLLEKLKSLDGEEVKAKTKDFLTGMEIKGVMARRDLIVKLVAKLVDQKGESQVLY